MAVQKKVVILGAGFAGIAALRQLKKTAALGLAEVTIVDQNRGQLFTPLLYEVATAYAERENFSTEPQIAKGVTLDIEIMAKKNNARFVCAEVMQVQWAEKIVALKDGTHLPYDYLFLALGSESNHMGIPGVKEFALQLKSLRDAQRIRQRVHDLLFQMEKQSGRLLRIVLAGGGPSGVELASELMMLLKKHIDLGHIDKENVEIMIVESKPRLLSMLSPVISLWVLERLRKIGIVVHRDACVKEVRHGEVVLMPRPLKEGEKTEDLACGFRHEAEMIIPAELFVWAAGVRGATIFTTLGLKTEPGGRVKVSASLECEEYPGVFVAGDGALVQDPATHETVPWTAQGAMTEGKYVGKTIHRRIMGLREPDARMPFKKYGTVVTVGGKWAVVEFGPFFFRGFLGWVGRKVVDAEYFFSVLPPKEAIKTWWRGLRLFGKND